MYERIKHGRTGDFDLPPALYEIRKPYPSSKVPIRRLEDVEDKVVSLMIGTTTWIKVVPLLVVYRNSHFVRIAVIQAVTALEVLLPPIVMGIIHIGVMIKSFPVSITVNPTPLPSIGPRLSVGAYGKSR